jgi:hypothetical protein
MLGAVGRRELFERRRDERQSRRADWQKPLSSLELSR